VSESQQPAPEPEISGKWVILGLACFGITMTGIMWVYWWMHVGPFVSLQKAIIAEQEFADSRPVVQGGTHKSRPENPNTLRVTMKVEFDPTKEENQGEVDRIEQKVLELAQRSLAQFDEFELFELNLFWPVQESQSKPITTQRHVELPVIVVDKQ
jgi:hypothetical protein